MSGSKKINLALAISFVLVGCAALAGAAHAQDQKPNILFIMGDDIGWMQPSIYDRGLMVEETLNIDHIGKKDAIFRTTLDGVDQRDYLEIKAEQCAQTRKGSRHGARV